MATIKQYVNLPRKPADHHGSSVLIEVGAAQLGEGKIGTSEWWVDPVGADNTDLKYLSKLKRCRMASKYARNRRDKFRNTLILPHVGGDKYKASCSKKGDRSSPKEGDEYETWRKIFYTVHWMNQACKDTFDAVKARFEDAFKLAFIEIEKKADSQTKVDEPRTIATPPHLPHLYDRRPVLSNKPFHLRIVVLNDIYDAVAMVMTWASTQSKHLVLNIAPEEFSDHTATHWLRSARARVLPNGTWVNIRKYVNKTGPSGLEVDLTAHKIFSKAIDKGKSLKVQVTFRQREHYLGHSLGNFVCVRINEVGTAAQIQRTILQTFTHEVGHGFQQAVRREALFKPDGGRDNPKWEDNPMWHTNDYGGQGPHCHKNAKVVVDPAGKTSSGFTYVHDAGTLCTMFFRDDAAVDADGKFCDHCLPRMKRVGLGADQMSLKGWGRF